MTVSPQCVVSTHICHIPHVWCRTMGDQYLRSKKKKKKAKFDTRWPNCSPDCSQTDRLTDGQTITICHLCPLCHLLLRYVYHMSPGINGHVCWSYAMLNWHMCDIICSYVHYMSHMIIICQIWLICFPYVTYAHYISHMFPIYPLHVSQ